MSLPSLDEIVRQLALVPHPEGGFYRETYRAPIEVPTDRGVRAASTSIYFLVPRGSFSALHRIRSDEVWHHYAGASLEVVTIDDAGVRLDLHLGADLAGGERPQGVVPSGVWFGARISEGDPAPWALVGCTVAPGFDFADFELAERGKLQARFPAHAAVIEALSRA